MSGVLLLIAVAIAGVHVSEPDGPAVVAMVRAGFVNCPPVEIVGSRVQRFNELTPEVVRAYIDAAPDLPIVEIPAPGDWRPQYARRTIWAGPGRLRIEERDRTLGGPESRATAVWIYTPERWVHAESIGTSRAQLSELGPWSLAKEWERLNRNITTFRYRGATECFPEAAQYLCEMLSSTNDLVVSAAKGFDERVLIVRSPSTGFGMAVEAETGALRAGLFPLLGGSKAVVVRYDGAVGPPVFPATHPRRFARFVIDRDANDLPLPTGFHGWELFDAVEVIPLPAPELFRWQSLSSRAEEVLSKSIWNADETIDQEATERHRRALAHPGGPSPMKQPKDASSPPAPVKPVEWSRILLGATGAVILGTGVVLAILRRRAG